MIQQRYNVFNQIHKGLRALLYDTALCIQQTDFNTPAAQQTVDKVMLVVDLFDEHANHEDAHLLPLAEIHNPRLVEEFESEHEVDHRLSQALRDHATAWDAAATENEKIMHGQALFYSFNEFIAFNLYHMNKEENVLQLNLWKHYTDNDLHMAERAIIESIQPEILITESRWMMRSLSANEIIQWLKGIQFGAPAEVFNMYLGMAQEEVSPERWQKIAVAFETPAAA